MLLLLACAPAEDSTPIAEDLPVFPACTYGFTADVREGPDAGAAMAGALFVVDWGDGTQSGALLSGADEIDPSVAIDGSAVTLDFALDAGTIHGTGSMDADLASCTGTMEGDLTGPADGDSGDWLGTTTGTIAWEDADLPAASTLDGCYYAYSDAELGGSGTLFLGYDSDGSIDGFVVDASGAWWAATGALSGTTLSLRIYPAVGATVARTLTLTGSLSGCAATLTEATMGPRVLLGSSTGERTADPKMSISTTVRGSVTTSAASVSRGGSTSQPKKSFAQALGTLKK